MIMLLQRFTNRPVHSFRLLRFELHISFSLSLSLYFICSAVYRDKNQWLFCYARQKEEKIMAEGCNGYNFFPIPMILMLYAMYETEQKIDQTSL